MSNEVEIVVVATDKTSAGFNSARRNAAKAGHDSGRDFGTGMGKSLTSQAGKFASAGMEMGTQIGLGAGKTASSALSSSGPAGAAITAGLVGIAAVAAPAMGALLAAGVIGGAGAGGIIGGIMLVKNDPRVQAVGSVVGQRIMSGLKLRAEPIVEPLIDALRIFDGAFQKSGDNFGKIFKDASKWIRPLAEAGGEFINDVSEGLASLTGAGGPVFDVLADGARDLGEAIKDGMNYLSDVGPEAALALQIALDGAEFAVKGLFGTVGMLAKAFGEFIELGVKIAEKIPGDSIIESLGRDLDGFRSGMSEAQAGMDGLRDSADQTVGSLRGVADALRAQTDPAFALIDAQDQLNQAQHQYNSALREHGLESSEVEAAEIALAKASLGLQDATEAAGTSFRGTMTPALRATLEAAGLTETQIAGVEAQFRSAAQGASEFEGTYAARVQLHGGPGVMGMARNVRAAVNAIPSTKVVTIYSRVLGGAISGAGYVGRATGGNIGSQGISRAATGGARGNMTLVGEAGPELVRLPFGSSVMTSGQTRNTLADYARKALSSSKIHEDFSFAGMGNTNLNQKLADMFYAQNKGYDFTGNDKDYRKFLKQIAATGSSSGSDKIEVEVRFVGNTDSAFATAWQKLERTGAIQISARNVRG